MMNPDEKIKTYLSFIMDNEYFAVNVGKVLEVLQKKKITRVPNATDDIKGVINFRGEIIPVFETRSRFGLPERLEEEKFVIIVLEVVKENKKTLIGAITDRVKDVITIEDKDILEVPKMSSKLKEDFIHGIYKLKEDFIMLLDVDKMFSENEVATMTEIVDTSSKL
jgi:purine-binding chemotaxis protein CheW